MSLPSTKVDSLGVFVRNNTVLLINIVNRSEILHLRAIN